MAIFPKCENLKMSMIACTCLGILPSERMFVDSRIKQVSYILYSNFIFGYFILFTTLSYVQLAVLFRETPMKKNDIYLILCTSLIYIVTIPREWTIRFSTSFKKILQGIIDEENKEEPIHDEKIKDIERKSVGKTNRILRNYIFLLLIVLLLFHLRPAMSIGSVIGENGNTTMINKPLPLPAWLPFDEQKYFGMAYTLVSLYLTVGALSVMSTDVFMINLIIYPSKQLKKLDHMLRNFVQFKRKFMALYDVDDELAGFWIFRYFIIEHKKIVKYVDTYNANMAHSMVVDFIQSSFQIASIISQIGQNKLTFVMVSSTLLFVILMVIRLHLFYYNANEVMVWSEKLASSIWESNWPEESSQFKYMMIIFMMRAQKPLLFYIGGFGVMSVSSVIAVLKATYSYIVIFNQ